MKDSLFDVFKKSINIKKIPVRPGEKFHESLISEEELRNTYEINDYYVIVDKQINQDTFSKWDCLEETKRTEQYSSDKVELLTKDELIEILINEKLVKND